MGRHKLKCNVIKEAPLESYQVRLDTIGELISGIKANYVEIEGSNVWFYVTIDWQRKLVAYFANVAYVINEGQLDFTVPERPRTFPDNLPSNWGQLT